MTCTYVLHSMLIAFSQDVYRSRDYADCKAEMHINQQMTALPLRCI